MSSSNPFGKDFATPGASRSFSGERRGGGRPQYMTVGAGSTSESAAKLQSMLEADSGYEGSIAGGDDVENSWHPGPSQDRFTPDHTPMRPGETNAASEDERRVVASHVHQLVYNQNRTALARTINQTVDTLRRLQEMNAKWPAHYPTVQRPAAHATQHRTDLRPGLAHTLSTLDGPRDLERIPTRPQPPKRAGTSLGEHQSGDASDEVVAKKPEPAPRLVTPQLAQDFSVLKIELKMEGLPQSEIVHSLEKSSVAALLDNQINNSIRHLFSLRERIEDTSSKVLVTGDLNAGKSTFCNALLRRKVLPEDQQPCTSIFCEVLDVRENGGVEEVHAIPHGYVYNRNDESTYRVFALKQLEDIVVDSDHYSQCKIYIKDIRAVDQSLLNNGVVDIALIDAPGLNNDSLKTTAVFARQEEIDVVVFVVSAANHFTLSAKEFIFNAAQEKAYMFMVVNGFDNIRDKNRCKEMILRQVAHLSPATFKESSELVHFVSSNAIPVAPAPGNGPGGDFGGSGSGSASFDGHDDGKSGKDDGENEGPTGKHGEPGSPPNKKGKGKEKDAQDDFSELEISLRRFVLEKRARSKLAPARTYLMNVLGDLTTLAGVNKDVAQNELDRVTEELRKLEPVFEQSKKARSLADDQVANNIDTTSNEVYSLTRNTLNSSIARIAEADLGVQYPGVFGAYGYADHLKVAMLDQITANVRWCEERAREKTIQGVSGIKSLGLLHLGDQYVDLTFRSEKMFKTRKDALARQVEFEPEVWDFFDFASLWERQEKVAGTSMAVTVAGVVGTRLIGGVGWLDGVLTATKLVGTNNARRLIIPSFVVVVGLGVAYAISQIPNSLPRRLGTKLSAQLAQLDYTHANSTRISTEVRRALKYPADKLREGLQKSVEHLQEQRRDTVKVQQESEVARKYFGNLVRDSNDIRTRVERVDLEGPAPETRGDLQETVSKFREWLQNQVIELEVTNGTPSPKVDPSVHVILIGHSMGGIVAAETLLSIARDEAVPKSSVANNATNSTADYESGASDGESASSSAPPAESSKLLFVQAILAFDTPYLGISPGVLAHGAEEQFTHASVAYKAYDQATQFFGWGSSKAASPQPIANASSKGLPAPDAQVGGRKWGKRYAIYGGAAAAIAGAAGAAYLSWNQINQGLAWASSHLEYVGCLGRGAELQKRVESVVELTKTHDVGFANYYTALSEEVSIKTQNAGAIVGQERTFCVVPKDARRDESPTGTERTAASAESSQAKRQKTKEEQEMQREMEEGEKVKEYVEDTSKNKGIWIRCVNPAVPDELRAHVSMFAPKTNPNYHVMLPQARDQIVGWVMSDQSWYERSDGPIVQEQPLAEEEEEDATCGGEADAP
ncbi:hypothetical protein LTR08_000259 [Meristemomyces frigidus]|nr:hypothetical protein LTR08_000259 [Meristemomyces frigidus]